MSQLAQELAQQFDAIDKGLLALDETIPYKSATRWTKAARETLDTLTFEWEQLHSHLTGHTPPHPHNREPKGGRKRHVNPEKQAHT